MNIVGLDFHPGWQQIAVFDPETRELQTHKLSNRSGEAERFSRRLPSPSLIGLEASSNSQSFEDLLRELGHEVWIGDAAQVRASYVCKQKTDKHDAGHILRLLRTSPQLSSNRSLPSTMTNGSADNGVCLLEGRYPKTPANSLICGEG
jgi:transposase